MIAINRPLRILRVADVLGNRPGGMSRAIRSLGEAMAARGHRVDYLFQEDLNITCATSHRRFQVPIAIPRKIREKIRTSGDYDIVDIHEPLSAIYSIARTWNRSLPPLLVSSHGLEERGRRAMLDYYKSKSLPVSFKQRYSPLSVVLQAQYGVRHGSHVVCCSNSDTLYLQRSVAQDFGVTYQHNGISEEFLAKSISESKVTTDRSGILFVGSWIHRKGILDIIPAISQVMTQFETVEFTVAGCGTDDQAIISSFPANMRSRINVIPFIESDDELISIYRSHSVIVIPSYFEGQPLVMLESAASGMAIVATSTCGMLDFIENEVNGILIPIGSIEQLIISLDRLLADENFARKLGKNAETSVRNYTWSSAAEYYEKACAACTVQS